MQEEVGGKPKGTETPAGPDGKTDRFMELKAIMMGRLATIKSVSAAPLSLFVDLRVLLKLIP